MLKRVKLWPNFDLGKKLSEKASADEATCMSAVRPNSREVLNESVARNTRFSSITQAISAGVVDSNTYHSRSLSALPPWRFKKCVPKPVHFMFKLGITTGTNPKRYMIPLDNPLVSVNDTSNHQNEVVGPSAISLVEGLTAAERVTSSDFPQDISEYLALISHAEYLADVNEKCIFSVGMKMGYMGQMGIKMGHRSSLMAPKCWYDLILDVVTAAVMKVEEVEEEGYVIGLNVSLWAEHWLYRGD
ncbi:hypothetical protein Tco_0546689 [Tanacetum coccineum]